jgi:hypothetical protein
VYCLECAKRGAKGAVLDRDDPMSVLRALQELGDAGDLAARRLYFGVLWDEGRSILCYRCKRGRPVRLTDDERARLEADPSAEPVAPTTPSSAVGEKVSETTEPANEDERRAA